MKRCVADIFKRKLSLPACQRPYVWQQGNVDSLDLKVGVNRLVFRWLDYLLALSPPEEIKDKAGRLKSLKRCALFCP